MPAPVVDAIKNYIDEEAIEGGYETFNRHEEDFERFYQQAARLINCHSGEIAFVENATRAWDMIFYSLPWKAGDVILTSMAEYASNYIAYLQLNKKFGVEVKAVPNASDGALCVDSLKKMIDARTALVAVTHVPTNGGLVNPAIEIGRVARERELPYLLDACQSVGQLDVDVEEIGCDFLSATGRKYLRGPRGTGFLYVRKSRIKNIEPVFLDLHAATWVAKDSFEIRDDARRFENWEQNYAGKYGLTRAIEYALALGTGNIQERVLYLGNYLRQGLASLTGDAEIEVTDTGSTRCGIVSFRSARYKVDEIIGAMKEHRINLSSSTTSGTRLDMEDRGLTELVRASVHYYNTEAELDLFIAKLADLHSALASSRPRP